MAKGNTATVSTVARKPVKELRAKPTGEVVALPTRGKNEPDLISETAIMAAVHTAIADYDTGIAKEGSATQRLAYAIMAKYARLVRDGATVPTLSLVAFNRATTAELMLHIREWAIGERPPTPNDDASATAMDNYNRHNALLNRSAEFASVLDKCNVQMSQFNDKTGNWTVPARALFPSTPVHTLLGNDPARMVPLDNRGYGATTPNDKGSPKFVKANASVRAMVAAAKPAPVKSGNATNANQGAATTGNAKLVDDIKKMPLPELKAAFADPKLRVNLFAMFHSVVVKDAGADDKMENYSPTEQNMWADLARHYAMLMHRASQTA